MTYTFKEEGRKIENKIKESKILLSIILGSDILINDISQMQAYIYIKNQNTPALLKFKIYRSFSYYTNTDRYACSNTHLVPIFTRQHLKDSQEGYGKWIEIGRWCSVRKIESPAKQLHSKEGKNEDEQEKEK